MASKAKIASNERRKALTKKFAGKRAALKAIIYDPKSSIGERMDAAAKLSQLPRDSSRTRIRNRCVFSGRPRGVYRKFGLSRIAIRDLGLSGQIPGLTKSSW